MYFLTGSLLDILHWTHPVLREKALKNTLVQISAQVHLSVQLKLSSNLNKKKRKISATSFGRDFRKNLVTFVKNFFTRQFLLCFFFISLISARARLST